ncbi:MAG TPA: hypothetical protein VFG89_00415 [Coriobacteriia bacterium]|nr:hypothetical protein [Coriobacteriia bacterium]
MKLVSRWAALAVLALSLVLPAAALAAPATFSSVEVAVHPEQTGAVMIVSGTLAEDVALPAEVELAVPAGARLQWAGEILGGSPDADPSVDYKVETRDGLDVYSFSMKSSRTAQLEILPSDLVTTTPTGMLADVTWTPSTDLPRVTVNYLLPQTASVLTPADGAEMSAGPEGYSYYVRTVDNAKAGEPISLKFGYSLGAAAAPTTTTPKSNNDSIVLVAILGAVLLAFAGLAVGVVRKAQAKAAASEQPAGKPHTARMPKLEALAEADEVEAESVDEAEPAGTHARPRTQIYLLVGVLVVIGLAAGLALGSGGKASVIGDVATLQIASVDTCTTSNIALKTPEGADLAKDANDILGRLKSVTGVGNASLYIKESRLEVAYCDSNTSEELIRAALEPTGYLADSAPATGDPSAPAQ